MQKSKLLISVQDQELQDWLCGVADKQNFDLSLCGPQDPWIDQCEELAPQLVIAQVDNFSEAQLERFKENSLPKKTEIIFVSGGKPNKHIDQAMKCGVSFHLRTPVDKEFLQDVIGDLRGEFKGGKRDPADELTSHLDQFGLLLGSSKPMRELYQLIRKAASSDASVLIIGESGAGKELVANSIHILSKRRQEPFMSLNCGAISPELIESELFGHVKGSFTGATGTRNGVFEHADGSTLFLDEITEMPIDQQVKLLRVLETGEFRKVGSETNQHADVRIVAACNREPAQAIREDEFREDLYFRLAQFPIRVPPLRDRGEDIPGLTRHFLAYRNAEEGTSVEIDDEALEKIKQHSWPGNVRELKHTVERAYILADSLIEARHVIIEEPISDSPKADVPTGMSLDEIEKQVILKVLRETDGKKKESAERLGISVKTLYNKLEKYGEQAKAK